MSVRGCLCGQKTLAALEISDRNRHGSGPDCDCIGAGVTQYDGVTCCYLFVGESNGVNFYG